MKTTLLAISIALIGLGVNAANSPIGSASTTVTTVSGTEYVPLLVLGSANEKITVANLSKAGIASPSNLSFTGGTNVAIVGATASGAPGVLQYRLTLTTNAYLQVPSGIVVDGTTMRIEVIQNSAGTWQVSCDTNSSGGFRFAAVDMIPLSGTQNVIPCTTNATAHDVLTFWYSGSLSKWLVSYSRGYFP